MAVPLEYNAGLDSVDSCSVALNLLPLVLQQHGRLKRRETDRCVFSIVHTYSTVQHVNCIYCM